MGASSVGCKGWLGRGPSPFTSNPSGGQPRQPPGCLPRPAESCRPSFSGCFSPGLREGFPLQLCCSFLFSACPRWNNYNMAFKLQHHKKLTLELFRNRKCEQIKWSIKKENNLICQSTMTNPMFRNNEHIIDVLHICLSVHGLYKHS